MRRIDVLLRTQEHVLCEVRATIKIWAFGVFRQIKGWARQGRGWIDKVRPGHTHTHAHTHTCRLLLLVLSRHVAHFQVTGHVEFVLCLYSPLFVY